DSMTPSGNTNITIGMAWGLAALASQEPLPGAKPYDTPALDKVMVVLTDGDNTENRWTHVSSQIDARTRLACDAVKDRKIKLYTIRVIAGNAELLRECASAPDMYYEVRNAGELGPVFQRIAAEITTLRLTH